MKLQLSLDLVTMAEAVDILNETNEFIDIIEIGTPLIIKEGVAAIRQIRDIYPYMNILADVKIMDGGKPEANYVFEAGADIVTVLAAAEDATIKGTIEVARTLGKKVMIDMIAIRDLESRAREIAAFGADFICVHTAFDIQYTGKSPLDELLILKNVVRNAKAAVAGGITLTTVSAILQAQPEILIVGGAITTSNNPRNIAQQFRRLIIDAEKKTIVNDIMESE